MKFTILGAPRTKKTSQRIVTSKRTGKPFIIASKQTKGWTKTAVEQLMAQSIGKHTGSIIKRKRVGGKLVETVRPVILTAPVNCRALFYRDRAIGDPVNLYQALADALEEAGVVANDRLIASWDGSRLLVDRAAPRIELELTAAEAA